MIELREHQTTVIDALREKNKGQIIVPTGGGKTMCMLKMQSVNLIVVTGM